MKNILNFMFYEEDLPVGLAALGLKKKQALEPHWDLPKILKEEIIYKNYKA